MRLVQFQLRPQNMFWFLNDIIKLDTNNRMSDFLDVDHLDNESIDIVNNSIKKLEIKAFDMDGQEVDNIKEVNYIAGEHNVNIEDEEEPDAFEIPEIVSITVADKEEPPIEEAPIVVTEEYLDEAKILLNKNGNTVRKAVRNMPQTKESLVLLHACLQVETANRLRSGVLKDIEFSIAGYDND